MERYIERRFHVGVALKTEHGLRYGWRCTVPFEVKNVQDIKKLIQCVVSDFLPTLKNLSARGVQARSS
jgi:hypothetical protein